MDIHIFTTGGSIDKTYCGKASDFIVGPPAAAALLKDALAVPQVEVSSVLQKDSLDISDEDRAKLVQRVAASPCPRVIITHGTDTMAQTGQALAHLKDKTIILTGAMQPASFKHSDAPFNLGGAVIAVQTLPPGVYIVSNGQILDPHRVRKNVQDNRYDPM